METGLIILVAIIGIAIFLFEWGMLRSVYSPEKDDSKKVKERIASLKQEKKAPEEESLLKDGYLHKSSDIYRKMSGVPGFSLIIIWSEQAGETIKADKFLWTSLGTAAVFGIFSWLVLSNILISIPATLFGFFIPTIKLYLKKNKRLNQFDEQLPEALDIMTRALRAGHPFSHTLKLVADELNGAISEEMALTFAELNFGVAVDEALSNLIRRVPSKALKSLVTAILLQRETGGNLAEILEKISGVVRGSYKFQRKLKSLSAEGKLSAVVLASVPLVLGAGISLIAPDIVSELITNPKGHTLLYGAGTLYVIGFIWISRVIKIEV